ncbi:hypothetical protein DFH11DRAFT_1590176 [Phellopilus nigrolimitatus]|nr:hypothetical protein DFH11DRAFT_1590176 [Phellopilus nigrolimitatus]
MADQHGIRPDAALASSTASQRDTFETLCKPLHKKPSNSNNNRNEVIRNIDFISQMRIYMSTNPALYDMFIAEWPKVLAWMEFLFNKPEALHANERQSMIDAFSKAFIVLGDRMQLAEQSLSASVRRRNSVLCVKLWLHEDMSNSARIHCLPTSALQICFVLGGLKETINELLIAGNNNAARVVGLALKLLRNSLSVEVVDHAHIDSYLFFTLKLCLSRECKPFLLPFNQQKGIASVTSAAAILSRSLSRDESTVPFTGRSGGPLAIDRYLACIRNALTCFNGVVWLAQAMRNGLLEIVANCCPFFHLLSSDAMLGVGFIIRTHIPQYLVNGYIVKEVISAMGRLEAENHYREVYASSISDDWRSIESLAVERLVYVRTHDRAMKEEGKMNACSNCNKIDHREKLLRCAKCKNARYCSKECQKIAWKTKDHKLECDMMAEDHDKGLHSSDVQLIDIVGAFDVRRHSKTLRETATRKYPSLGPRNFAYSVDYSFIPPLLEVFSVEDILALSDLADHQNSVSAALTAKQIKLHLRSSGGKMTLLKTISVDGDKALTKYSFIMADTSDGILRQTDSVLPVSPCRSVFRDAEGNTLKANQDTFDPIFNALFEFGPMPPNWFASISKNGNETKAVYKLVDKVAECMISVMKGMTESYL